MKKHTRIGLMFLATLILTLTLTIPGLAEKPTAQTTCGLSFLITNAYGNVLTTEGIPGGEFTIVGWVDDTLINTCTGDGIPFGEPVEDKNGTFTWLTYDDLQYIDGWDWTEDSATMTSADAPNGDTWLWVWDADDTSYKSTFWEATIYPDGSYEFSKVYTP